MLLYFYFLGCPINKNVCEGIPFFSSFKLNSNTKTSSNLMAVWQFIGICGKDGSGYMIQHHRHATVSYAG